MQAQAEAAMEAHFDTVNEADLEPGGALHFTAEEAKANPGGVLEKVCGLYNTVRPAVNFAANFWLTPGKIKRVLHRFLDTMDGLCPSA